MNYQLRIVNNSQQAGSFVIFQQQPNTQSLAWLTKYAYPQTNVTFNWTLDYDFVWSETGVLTPGVAVEVGQITAATPEQNQITLSYDLQNHAFFFQNQTQAGEPGAFNVLADSSVPAGAASVGIGMSGAATFLVQAGPNMHYTFTPHPDYWLVFSNTMQQGEVIVTESLSPLQINFPPNVNSMTVTLNPDQSWTVTPNFMLEAVEEA
ncbi:protein rhiA [Deinococcus cellulosilyticus]|uniref:Protein rhiA n=1 Tax=Deinococcus cellulosilyticus (strain DSM 18568 / NBRC 106333 / KACC 11606 / 5516J-15) TaxID=1223518 RepID=A0A511MVX3_DEIC1|nr:protein rhiA [Deinococcus cellulosilyticus]GEM44724.1 hypothetical protein DC3_03590 [Deinococcus cellulosilyticus NBRC 106333 = KACC 11606]